MKPTTRKGLGLAEVSIALALSALAGTFITVQLMDMNDRSRGRSAGEHMAQIAAAAKSVLNLHGEQIKTEISALAVNATRTYALDDQAGTATDDHWRAMLPRGMTYRNTYGHSYQLVVKKLTADNQFEGMVVSVPPSGQKMPRSAQAAAMIPLGASGGAVYDAAATVRGAGGGWSTASSDWASVAQDGSLASYLEFHIAGSEHNMSQYLSRFSDGNPEHNTMRTDLHLSAPLHANADINSHGALRQRGLLEVHGGMSMHNSNINMNGRDMRGATTVQSWHMAAEHFCRHNTDPFDCVSWDQLKNKVREPAGSAPAWAGNPVDAYCLDSHVAYVSGRNRITVPSTGRYLVMLSSPGVAQKSYLANLAAGDTIRSGLASLVNGASARFDFAGDGNLNAGGRTFERFWGSYNPGGARGIDQSYDHCTARTSDVGHAGELVGYQIVKIFRVQ